MEKNQNKLLRDLSELEKGVGLSPGAATFLIFFTFFSLYVTSLQRWVSSCWAFVFLLISHPYFHIHTPDPNHFYFIFHFIYFLLYFILYFLFSLFFLLLLLLSLLLFLLIKNPKIFYLFICIFKKYSFIFRTSSHHAFHTSWHCMKIIFHLFRKDQSTENYRQIFNKSITDQFPRKDWSTIYIADAFSGLDKSLNNLFWFFSRSLPVQFKSLNSLFWFFSLRCFLWFR